MTKTASGAPEAGESATKVSVEVAKAESDAVAAAMAQVTSLVTAISKAVGLPEDGGDDEAPVAKSDAAKRYMAKLKKSGMDAAAIATAMKAFGEMDGDDEGKGGKKAKAKKADEDVEKSDDSESTSLDGAVEGTLDAISKAKAFTPARIAKLNEALETLKQLQMDVIGAGSSPKSTVPAVSQHSNPNTTRTALSSGSAVMKAEDATKILKSLEAVVTKLESITSGGTPVTKADDEGEDGDLSAQLASISKRLVAIEKARPAPASESTGDGTDTTTKVNKSLWSNVL